MKTLDTASTPLAGLDRLSTHMAFHRDRQAMITANLANIDTPGYRAKDVAFTEQIQGHVVSFDNETFTADDEVPDQDGNTVALEVQVAKMSSNLIRYRSLAELLSRRVGLMRYAATDGHG